MNIVFLGDSITEGNYLSKTISQAMSEKYPLMDVVNLGVSGDYTSDGDTRKGDADKYNPFRVIVWLGINDISLPVSIATSKSNLQSIYTYYAGKGYEVWAFTITANDDNNPTMISNRDNMNTWITSTATGVDVVIDTFTFTADPANTDNRLPAYADLASPNHINDLGIADIVSTFL